MDDTSGFPVENNENSGTEIIIPENFVLIFKGAKAISLKQPITSIGRSHDNTIVIDDPRISRHHLEIRGLTRSVVMTRLVPSASERAEISSVKESS